MLVRGRKKIQPKPQKPKQDIAEEKKEEVVVKVEGLEQLHLYLQTPSESC